MIDTLIKKQHFLLETSGGAFTYHKSDFHYYYLSYKFPLMNFMCKIHMIIIKSVDCFTCGI